MKLIDADKILEALGVFTDKEQGDPHFLAAIASAREIIEGMPEAVVRCKDCKHSQAWYRDKLRCFMWSETGIDVFEDGYCSYGERKEDGVDR